MRLLTHVVNGFLALVALGCGFTADGGPLAPEGPHLRRAEQYVKRGEFDPAIAEYRAHIEERLRDGHRPEWENPSFYLLLIGDLQLEQGHPLEALGTFAESENAGVSSSLVADRYRAVARWYELQGELEAALAVLERFRSRDELLFDVVRDRLAKELVDREEEEGAEPESP